MNHDLYVAGAYAVFGVALAWDYLAPRLRLQRALRSIGSRARRDSARAAARSQP